MPTYNQPSNFLIMYPVKGEEGAMAYPVAPGQKVTLIDTESAVIYVKSTNALGQVLPLEVYDLVFRQPPMPEATVPAMSQDELTKTIDAAVKSALKRYFPGLTIDE